MGDELAELVEQALRRWPGIAYVTRPGNRARSAAALVREERVRHLGGSDWEVNNHRCTERTCDCADRAPQDEQGGKLCKHCIAVRMIIRLRGNLQLYERLQQIAGLAAGQIQLLIDRDYDNRKRVLVGYRDLGRDVRWPVAERVSVTYEQMTAALAGLGWSLAELPTKSVRWEYRFPVRFDTAGTPLTAAIWNMHGITDWGIERRRNQKLSNWAMQELAASPANRVQINERTSVS
jgi:hypothetical protein